MLAYFFQRFSTDAIKARNLTIGEGAFPKSLSVFSDSPKVSEQYFFLSCKEKGKEEKNLFRTILSFFALPRLILSKVFVQSLSPLQSVLFNTSDCATEPRCD